MDRFEGGQYIVSTLVSAERMCHMSTDGFVSISVQPKGASLLVFLKRDMYVFWPRWVFFAARRLSLAAASGGYSSLLRSGFSCGGHMLGMRALAGAEC